MENATIFNWRTGELSKLQTRGFFGYEGSPHGYAVSKYSGITWVKGASNNTRLEGPSISVGGTGSLDAGLGISGSYSVSQGVDPVTGVRVIDRDTNEPIMVSQISIGGSFNPIPNIIDAGIVVGKPTTKIIQTINIYEILGLK